MRLLLTIVTIISFQLSYVQNAKPIREPLSLKLAVDGSQFYEQEVKTSPYFVHEDILQIYPTEKIFIEVEVKSDTIFSMQVVKQNLSPKKTIELVFTQIVKDNKNELMMLKVTNPFKKELSYKARMYVIGNDKWISTSIMPIPNNIYGIETWPNVIISLALYNWKLN